MEFKETYLENLLNKKAEENNSIDLNAYALGIKDSKAPEMLKMLKECMRVLSSVQSPATPSILLYREIEELIKQATEL